MLKDKLEKRIGQEIIDGTTEEESEQSDKTPVRLARPPKNDRKTKLANQAKNLHLNTPGIRRKIDVEKELYVDF